MLGFRNLPAAFWTLWVGTLINRIGGFVMPLLTFYLTRERGLSPFASGVVVSLYGAGDMIAVLTGGILADRLGRKPTMLIGLFGGAVAMLLLGLAREPWLIGLAAFGVALVSDVYRPAASACITDLVPREDRLRAFGAQYWAINLGFSIAPVLAGVMAEYSYFALFAGDALTTALCGVLILVKLPETRPAATERAKGPGLAAVLADRVFMTFVLLSFLFGLIFQQAHAALPFEMAQHGLTPLETGMVLAVNGVLIITIQPFATHRLGTRRRSLVLAAAAVLTGAGFGLNALVATAPLYAVAVAVWTLGEIAAMPANASIVADLAPAELRGRYQGVFSMAFGVSAMLGPFAGNFVLDRFGAPSLWTACVVLGVFVAAGHLTAAAPRRARMEGLRAAAQ